MFTRIAFMLVLLLTTFHATSRAVEPETFVMVQFPVPDGWSRFQSMQPKTAGVLIHGGKTLEEADGMIQLDIGRPTTKTAREFAESIAGIDGTVEPTPIKLAGVEAVRLITPSNDFSRPKLAIVAFHKDNVFFLAAAAKPGFDVEPAMKAIIEAWHWRDTDQKRLTGEWTIERIEADGMAVTDPGVPTEISIRQCRFSFAKDGQPMATMRELVIVVDQDQKPAHLDLVRGMREVLPCIYEVKDDRLTIAMPGIPQDKKKEDPLPRPTVFDSSKEPSMVLVAKRKSPPQDQPAKTEDK